MYDKENKYMFDHVLQCNGRKDIITTRWYKKSTSENKSDTVKKEIVIDTTFRPVTR
jgi:hypothetical protein